jgi:putative PIN family toxin of toxin-antitoxin system
MRRAVLDSSVLISALPHASRHVRRIAPGAARGAFVLCISDEIIAETTRSLRQKTRQIRRYYPNYSDAEIDRFGEMIALTGDVVGDLPVLRVVPLDPKDDVIVATAIEAQAAYLVTGDRHLLALGSHSNIRMITPRQFLDLL